MTPTSPGVTTRGPSGSPLVHSVSVVRYGRKLANQCHSMYSLPLVSNEVLAGGKLPATGHPKLKLTPKPQPITNNMPYSTKAKQLDGLYKNVFQTVYFNSLLSTWNTIGRWWLTIKYAVSSVYAQILKRDQLQFGTVRTWNGCTQSGSGLCR